MDSNGRWSCYTLDEAGEQVISLPLEELEAAVRDGRRLWVNVQAPTRADTQRLKKFFHFHELALTDVLNNSVRPKQETYDQTLFTVFGCINLNPGEERLDTINLNLFMTPNYLVTTHCKPLKTIRLALKNAERGRGGLIRGTDFLYYVLLDGVIDRYLDLIDGFEEGIAEIEQAIFSDRAGRNIQSLVFDFKRDIAFLRRSIGPQRDALKTLVTTELPQISKEAQVHLRDVLDHVMRISDTLESYRELLNGLMDSYMSQISNRMNEVMKLMSIIATVMLPLSFLTGLFGMNFDNIPGLHWEVGFWVLLIAMAILAAGLIWFFRRRNIL